MRAACVVAFIAVNSITSLACCCSLPAVPKAAPAPPRPPTTGVELNKYNESVERSVRGQQFQPLMANATCQLTNHFAVRDLPNHLSVRVTTDDGETVFVILERHSSAASLLGDARPHRLHIELGPATRQTRADSVCLEIFDARKAD